MYHNVLYLWEILLDIIMHIFRNLAEQGKCVILVSHAPDVAAMCDETYELARLSRKGKK